MSPNPKTYQKKKTRRKIPPAVVQFVLEREDYTCEYCGKGYPPEEGHALHCHHVIKTSQGGRDNPDNLRLLCWACHGKKHR